jgi:hypothetical protein
MVDSANNNVKIIAGPRLAPGTWDIFVTGFQILAYSPAEVFLSRPTNLMMLAVFSGMFYSLLI